MLSERSEFIDFSRLSVNLNERSAQSIDLWFLSIKRKKQNKELKKSPQANDYDSPQTRKMNANMI